MRIKWEDRFSVGDATLDLQHRELLRLCGEAESCLHDDSLRGRERFHELLNDMAAFAARHFRAEEALLARCGYPDLASQEDEHAAYSEALTEFLFAALDGNLDRNGVHAYLGDWWVRHILDSDMRYKEYL